MPNFNLKDLMISLPDADGDQIPQTLCHGTQPCLPTLCHGTKPCLPTLCHIPTNCGGHTLCAIPTNCGGHTLCAIPTNCPAHSNCAGGTVGCGQTLCLIPTNCHFSPCHFSPIDCTHTYNCGGTITPTTPVQITEADPKSLSLLKEKLASAIKEVDAQIAASGKAKKG
jgi:hypothetical protein